MCSHQHFSSQRSTLLIVSLSCVCYIESVLWVCRVCVTWVCVYLMCSHQHFSSQRSTLLIVSLSCVCYIESVLWVCRVCVTLSLCCESVECVLPESVCIWCVVINISAVSGLRCSSAQRPHVCWPWAWPSGTQDENSATNWRNCISETAA